MQGGRTLAGNGRSIVKFKFLALLAASTWTPSVAFAQDASNSAPAETIIANKTQASVAKLDINQINVDLAAARADKKDKRFADAEALMLQATASRPDLLYPWVELGQAELGLKEYQKAETSFKVVLGLDSSSQTQAAGGNTHDLNSFGANTGTSVTGASNSANPERTPEIQGIAWSDLGEIYIHANKITSAQSAFDQAAKIDQKNAAMYRNNETLLFFQAGDAAAQVDAANKAIALDPRQAEPYYFKAQGLVAQATIDPNTQKIILPPGCSDAYHKYLALESNGQFANDAKTILAAAEPAH
jgi:tetratricopeptide (TPR) repeat protein